MDKNYVAYKNRFKKKAPQRGDHLKKYRWKPGESGNKDGRPTGVISLVERLKAYLRRHPDETEAIVENLVQLGLSKNVAALGAIKELLDRVDGKATEIHKITGELPITITFVPAHEILRVEPAQMELETAVEGEFKELS